jgi:hypothetical protein
MSWNEIPEGGKALLVIGGAVLAGLIIHELASDDESPRETRQSTSGKRKLTSAELEKMADNAYKIGKNSRKPKDGFQKILTPPKGLEPHSRKFIVEVPPPRQKPTSIFQGDNNVIRTIERKYPDHYYGLNKNQQYHFRLRLKKINQPDNPNNV